MEVSNTFVCLMGLGVVFVGLICIIALCYCMSYVCMCFENKKNSQDAIPLNEVAVSAALPAKNIPLPLDLPNREEFVAAVSAAIAEELGEEVSALRIISIKKLT